MMFSSVYTNLNTQCNADGPNDPNGGDTPLTCAGPSGYVVHIGYSACDALLEAGRGRQARVFLAQTEGNYDRQKGRRLEWRLASGVPFAVILRLNTYKDSPNRTEPCVYTERYKTGSVLKVVGLGSFGFVAGQVNAAQPNANTKARAFADAAFSRR